MNIELKERLDAAITNFIKNSWRGITINSVNELIKDAGCNLNILSFHDDFSAYYAYHKFLYLVISFNNVPYVLKFKNVDAVRYLSSKCCLLSVYDIVGFIDFNQITFDYDEPEMSVNDHLLKYTIFSNFNGTAIYTFDSDTGKALMKIDTEGDIFINKDLHKLLGFNFYYNPDSEIWLYVSNGVMPTKIEPLVAAQKIMLSLMSN